MILTLLGRWPSPELSCKAEEIHKRLWPRNFSERRSRVVYATCFFALWDPC